MGKHVEEYLLNNLTNLDNNSYTDDNPRPRYKSDGKPAYTKYINGVFESYDLSKGEFPITEVRYIPWKSGINEILAIYQSQTNSQRGFESHNINWWSDWMNKDGDIGRAYSYNLESHRENEVNREVVLVKNKIVSKEECEIEDIGMLNPIKKSIDGVIYKSDFRGYGEYIITDEFYLNHQRSGKVLKRKYVEVQFLSNGYITNVRKDSLQRGQHPKNNYIRTVYKVGYLGDYDKVKNFDKKEIRTLKKIWFRMITRCYDGTRTAYDNAHVHKDWHSFENFLRDVRYLPQYHLAKENGFINYQLDKDYYNSDVYSKDTCVFLNARDNVTYRKIQIAPLEFKSKSKKITFLSYMKASDFFGCTDVTIKNRAKKGSFTYNNEEFKVKQLELIDGYSYRYELSRNQINELIFNLKNNKTSRRHMLSFFNWSNIDKKMLVECAMESHWTYYKIDDEEYLDMTLIQRSSDYLTAGHINKIQYVALMMMIANECGYKLGKFNHFVQNLHVYDRQLEQLEEIKDRLKLLEERKCQTQPALILNVPSKTSFYDITVNDFELINYNPIKPQLKFDLAI